MAFAEDLSVFFDTAGGFAVTATLTPADIVDSPGGAGSVIFDANGLVLESLGIQTSGPSAVCPASQWPAIAPGQALDIEHASGTVAYLIRSATPVDDGALVLLALARN